MIRTTEFKIRLTADDEVDVKINRENGRITGFSVNYRTRISGKWHNVIRYDTAHGMIHVHRFWISTKPVAIKKFETDDIKKAVDRSIDDIETNWSRYKKYMIMKII